MEVMASMMFGCEDNKRINKVLREDNPEYSIFFGLPWWAEQSVVSDTFRAMTAENINQLDVNVKLKIHNYGHFILPRNGRLKIPTL